MSSNKTINLIGGKPWGFRIIGGNDTMLPLQIQQILSQKAFDAGLLKGDQILQINGIIVDKMSHQEAKQLLMDTFETLTLVIKRDPNAPKPASAFQEISPSEFNKMNISSSNNSLNSKIESNKSSQEKLSQNTEPIKLKIDTTDSSKNNIKQEKSNVSYVNDDSNKDEIKSPFLKKLIQQGPESFSNASTSTSKEKIVKINEPSAKYVPLPNENNNSHNKDTNIEHTKPKVFVDNDDIKVKNMQTVDRKTCHKCQNLIEDKSFISASQRFFHKNHFVCEKCDTLLLGKSYFEDENKKICCQKCMSDSSTDKCEICNKPIVGSFLTVDKKCFHQDCFNCKKCHKSLKNEKFIMHESRPCCIDCHVDLTATLCVKCKQPIKPGESFVEVEGGNCHSKCFTCKICKAPLSTFKVRDGYAICPKH